MSADNPLLASGVLTAEGGSVTLSEEFEEAVEEYLSRFDGHTEAEFADAIEERVGDEVAVEPFAALGEKDPRTVAELCALADRLGADDAKANGNPVQLLPSLRLFRDDDVRTDGVPRSFVPVPATQLPELLRIYSPALVYAWLDDSESCDLAKRDLEAVFEEPQEVMPFAVYGPDYREFLEREYSLTAGPAVLFTRDGEVEARLYGAHGPGTIETELERHRR
ncbi:hypothetical protein ACFPM1_06375 [Halorubrum rubrum]|uniref:Thioredoxin n=1 Tax=Halorubrum rubrum TaxID=1126240 RepID=A0ABD5R0K1_9EURY|nr:hypothetical protein [Halorubrum rubrum]